MTAHEHTLIRLVGAIFCRHCPLLVFAPAGMPDYRRASMSSWTRGRLKITS